MDGSAEVIPFRPRQDAARRADAAAQERLARALAILDAALFEQRSAMDRFQLAIGDLSRAVSRLESGLVRYGDELACVGHDLERLAIEARALEAWADEALARSGR
jgi:glutathione S-transferase